jgi:hypothetical protein
MNTTKAECKFYLNITSSNSGDVWPFEAREHPEIDERIRDSYYADEDDASCGFDIKDMEDLLKILKFYDGKSVRMTMGVEVTTAEVETSASLSPQWQGGAKGFFRSLEKDDISPGAASSKMIAIAHALSRWEKNQQKAKP